MKDWTCFREISGRDTLRTGTNGMLYFRQRGTSRADAVEVAVSRIARYHGRYTRPGRMRTHYFARSLIHGIPILAH